MSTNIQQALAAISADPAESIERFAAQSHPGEDLLNEKQAIGLAVAAVLAIATAFFLSVFVQIIY